MPTSDDQYREQARTQWAGDNLDIDDDAEVDRTDQGAWVHAWVFVYDREKEAS